MNFPLPPTTAVSLIAGGIVIFHLAYLLITKHAHLIPMGSFEWIECGDVRESLRGGTIFGGASAFDFGLPEGLVGMFIPMPYWLAILFIGYANMKFWASVIQTVNFIAQSAKASVGKSENFHLKSHLDGCTYTTVLSPLWILFWIQKIPKMGWVVVIRDVITAIDFVFSIPGIALLNVWTLVVRHKFTVPTIGHVDDPTA